MLWFLRGLRRGVVTTRYPDELDSWAASLPSPPAIDRDRLTEPLAARLEATCPSGALRRDSDALVLDLGACTGCGRCFDIGAGVVEASGEFLLASHARQELVKRVPFGAAAGQRASSGEERQA